MSFFAPFSLDADEPDVLTMSIEIGAVSAMAGEPGAASRLRFTITNEGLRYLTLLGIKSRVSADARFMAWTDKSNIDMLPSVGIPPGETVNLNTSHMWVELCPLKQRLGPGDVFSATLVFEAGELDVDVHVHANHNVASGPC